MMPRPQVEPTRVALAAFFFALILWLAYPAWAHSWYDMQCCHDRDCEPIPSGSVEDLGSKGYRVTYQSSMFGAVDVIVPRNKAKESKDGRDHFCGFRMGDEIIPRCLYLTVNT